ncbi:uncharacterized protein LOC105198908 [Solenopsis invicta]|uniref:uncharacterized protein LOC105198908 n=1 Tax=Solenopsis invicta TaxID=13686 RepID=UPI000595FFAE|nr:uncharacterized protein LOC105198908 [Solenopsis invicta]
MPLDRSPGPSGVVATAPSAAAPDLSSLRRQRGTIKGSCTRIETFVNSVNRVSSDIRAQLDERRARLDALYVEYCKVQSQLEALDESEVEDRIAFEDVIYSLCAKLRQLLQADEYRSNTRASTPGSKRVESESAAHVRLPKLNLPTFSGKYEEWFPFRDTFTSVIHNNKSLSDIQRFQYLRASLTDKALDIVKTLEISDSNYDLAWNILRDRYDNKRLIVQTHIKAIFELPAVV